MWLLGPGWAPGGWESFWERQEPGEGGFPSGKVGNLGLGGNLSWEKSGVRVSHSFFPSRDGDNAPGENHGSKLRLETGFWGGKCSFSRVSNSKSGPWGGERDARVLGLF